ncbi:MAG: hypothetical protein P8N02_19985, partial [Actinomycetota bacterium]|nr:hypothetical protein [Actinomycetota bacterium]
MVDITNPSVLEVPGDQSLMRTRLGRSAAWLVANGAFTLVLGAAYWMLAARRLGSAEMGRAATELSQVLLAANLGVVGVKHSTARALAAGNVDPRRLLRVEMTVTALGATVAGIGVELVTHGLGLGAPGPWSVG